VLLYLSLCCKLYEYEYEYELFPKCMGVVKVT